MQIKLIYYISRVNHQISVISYDQWPLFLLLVKFFFVVNKVYFLIFT